MRRLRRLERRLLVVGLVAIGAVGAFIAIERRSDPPLGFAVGAPGMMERVDSRDPAAPRGTGTIDGSVLRADGSPATGAIVSARPIDAPGLPRVTVYCDAGRFRIEKLAAARYALEAYEGATQAAPGAPVDLAVGATTTLVLTLAQPRPDAYPAAYFAARLHFPSKQTETDFRVQCRYCHQFGTERTRKKRTPAEWDGVIQVMTGMGAAPEPETRRILANVLADGMRPDPLSAPAPPGAAKDAIGAVLEEWPLGMPASYMHDLAVGRGNWIYAIDMNSDVLSGIDTGTGAMWNSRLPARDHPIGGYFQVASRAIGTTGAHQGPHSVELGPDGRLWVTASLGNELIAVTPSTGATQHWSLPRGSFYPHSLRVSATAVWFTIAISNQLGKLDPRDGSIQIVSLPTSRFSQHVASAMMPFLFGMGTFWPGSDVHMKYLPRSFGGTTSTPVPYGIDVGPDGAVWYSKLYDDRIGRVDPQTLAVREWVTPFAAPRRLAVARDGGVWIPGFGSSLLARFDPATEAFRTWPMPSSPPGLEAPYAVAISPVTGHVWVTSTQTDVLYRFDPQTEHFTVFPLPTRAAFMREIEFRPDGEVCTCYSNNPESHMPDATQKILCLRPSP